MSQQVLFSVQNFSLYYQFLAHNVKRAVSISYRWVGEAIRTSIGNTLIVSSS